MLTTLFARYSAAILLLTSVISIGCRNTKVASQNKASQTQGFLSKPLVTHIYTADPSAHVFNGRIYIYPSHDYESGVPEDDLGSHFAMRDFHILSMDSITER
ncbi:MAG: hypothetical protein WKG06_23385 [Segetibacter sp.]